jgi:hypothetical protein
MAFDHVPLDRPPRSPGAPPPGARSGPARWIVLGAVVLIAGGVVAWSWMSRFRPESAAPASTSATDVTVLSRRPKRQQIDLPPLDASDTLIRDAVALLSSHPLVSRLVVGSSGLARAVTVAVVQIGDGRTPIDQFAPIRPADRLTIVGTGTGRLDPASYHRWDAASAALTSIDPAKLAQLYVNVKPLIDQAYRELGYPNGDFDEAIVRAIKTLDDTPQPAADPLLSRNRGYYEHEDPALKALLPVQKQLLLMGPDNRRRLMAWLRHVASALELNLS